MAVVVGGISALVWGLRNRVRIAVGVKERLDPDFSILDPLAEEAADQAPEEVETDPDSQSSADDEPSSAKSAANGAG